MQKVSIELDNPRETLNEAHGGFLEKLSFILCAVISFLLPLFFIPSVAVPFHGSKMILLSLLVLAALVLWIIARLKDGQFVFPGTYVLFFGGGVVLSVCLSAIFSGAMKASFIGQALNLGTAGSIAILFLLLFLVPLFIRTRDRIFYAYLGFFAAFFLIALFQLLRLIFGPGLLSMGIFTDVTSNTIGTWNDLGVFFGIGAVLSLITLELISLGTLFRVLTYAVLVVSLLFLAIVNFTPIWYILAFFSLVFLVYVLSFSRSDSKAEAAEMPEQIDDVSITKRKGMRKISATSLATLIISLVFILNGAGISGYIGNKFGIFQMEVHPSWAATFTVAKSAVTADPLLGAGPNRFSAEWQLYRPNGVNATPFWNADFNFGVGFVPTFLVTTGLLGALAWLVFLGYLLYAGFRAVLSPIGDKVSRYLITSSFLVSLFLWIIAVFYTPSLTIITLTFFFTGLFLSSLYESGIIKPKVISFIDDPRKGFVSVLALILLLIGSVAVAYAFIWEFMAAVNFQSGIVSYNNDGNVDKAEAAITKAVSFGADPSYYRSLVQIDLLRLNNLFSQNSSSISADSFRSQFQGMFSTALNHAQQAVSLDSNDYQNWFYLGQVYGSVVPLKIQNSYESANMAYQKALSFYPTNPMILLSLARLEVAHGNNAAAKNYIGQALQQKNDYTDAIFLLAQIQVGEGNLAAAISSVQAASVLTPNDSGVFFQLGLLRYNVKDYQGAADALLQAIALTPQYANAKYFLGLSYQKLGRVSDAIAEFKDLQATNPDNKEISLILSNLINGKDPFANATPPIDNKPEKRATPPVSDKPAVKTTKSKSAIPAPSSGNIGVPDTTF